ncbi:hypothetical protein ACIBSW_39565 [Actinoplanes sp. NPDC049668]|uniref:hypothetical protein n=1 Tax=unclassified Actinoplanes TaxID=2626549 RepID=UPI0033AC7377
MPPQPCWADDTCGVCPGQSLGPGGFDVVARPGYQFPFRPELGYRATPDGTPICVHPYRVGMPVGAYASGGVPVPDLDGPAPDPSPVALEMPEHLDDLAAWLVAVLRIADSDELFRAAGRAERQALERFPAKEVVKAMRHTLSRELPRRSRV